MLPLEGRDWLASPSCCFFPEETLSSLHWTGWMERRAHLHIVVKVKKSRYRSGQTVRVPGGWGSQISRQSTHEGGKVVSPTPPIPMTPSGIEPANFRLIAQCLNQLRHRVPPKYSSGEEKYPSYCRNWNSLSSCCDIMVIISNTIYVVWISAILYSLQTCRTLRCGGLGSVQCQSVSPCETSASGTVRFILGVSFHQSSIINSSLTNDM